jgi:pyruvate dehydrogenase E1 component alpha subunit
MTTDDTSLKKEDLLSLFSSMLRIRLVEEAIAEYYPEQEMRCPVHLSIGQEAVAVGVCANLSAMDYVLSNHRSHDHFLAKGGNLNAMIAEILGKKDGCTRGKGGSMHLIDLKAGFLGAVPIVGSTIPIAAGVALGTLMKGEKKITTVFFGDGTIEEGVFHEALNFAALKKLPLLFVCENNLYSVYSPLSVRQPANRQIISIARGHGIQCFKGDGNDVLEVYRLTKNAVNTIIQNGGPVFLEFSTYRWREHCGPNYDNTIGYRTEKEFLLWKEQCPIERFKHYVIQNEIIDSDLIEKISKKIKKEIKTAIETAKKSEFPDKEELFEGVYAR